MSTSSACTWQSQVTRETRAHFRQVLDEPGIVSRIYSGEKGFEPLTFGVENTRQYYTF